MGTLPNEEVTCPLQRLNAGEERGLDRLMECNSTPPGERTPTILLSQTTSAFINPWFKKG